MNEAVLVELEQIQDNPYQMRADYDAEKIKELAVDIATNTLLQVPAARQVNGHYQLVYGHRRKRAFELLATTGVPEMGIAADPKFKFMPLQVRELDDFQMFDDGLSENLKRDDLKPTERARAIQKYLDFGKTSKEAAVKFGLGSDATVRGLVRLLDLPKSILREIDDGKITQGNARRLLTIQRVAPKEVKTVAKELSRSDLIDPDAVISNALKNTGNSVEMWPSWRQDEEPMAGSHLWPLRLPAEKFPRKHLPSLSPVVAGNLVGMKFETHQDKNVMQNRLDYFQAGGKVEDMPGAALADLTKLERLEHLINPPACSACPFYAKINGGHWCTFKECFNRKARAWQANELDAAVEKLNIKPYDHKVDGAFCVLTSFYEKHKKLVADGHADLRLRKGQTWNNFTGVPDGFVVVAVGTTGEKLKAAEQKNNSNSTIDREAYYKEQDRLRAIRKANQEAMNDFLWNVATPVFQSLLNDVKTFDFIKSLSDRYVSGVPAEEPSAKASKADRLAFYRRAILFELIQTTLDMNNDLWRIAEKKHAITAMLKPLQKLAITWGVKLPKDIANQATEADKAIVVAVETVKT